MTDTISDVMADVTAGRPLTTTQQRALVETYDLVRLGMVAGDVRARRVGTRGTFVRIDTVPLTTAAEADLSDEAGEIRLTGSPESLAQAVSAVAALRRRCRTLVTGFTVHDLALAAGKAFADWCIALRDAGLSGVAFARVDRLDDDLLDVLARTGLPLQSLAPGWPPAGEALLAVLHQVSAWQERHGVITAFQPLAVDSAAAEPSTGYDDMRAVAVARIVLENVPHIQVDWSRAGAKLSQACLLFGADDIDAVPARDDMPHGPRRSVLEEVRRNFAAVSLTPVERTARFETRTGTAGAGIAR